jgi:hypothetical protein
MQRHELARDGEPQPRAALLAGRRAVALRERFEDRVEEFRGDARPGVGDRHVQPAVASPGRHLDGAGRCEFHRIADQVEQDLLDPVLVGLDQRHVGLDPVEQAQGPLPHQRTRHGQHEIDESVHVGGPPPQLDLLVAQLREIEQVVHEVGEPPSTGDDHEQIAPLLFIQSAGGAVQHRLADADDAIQRRAQVVRSVGQELVLDGVGAPERLLRLLAGRDVPDDAGERAPSRHGRLAERQLQGEGRAVPAQALQLAARTHDAGLAGLQVARQVVVVLLAVRRRHQQGHVSPDQVRRRMPEHPLDRQVRALHDAPVVDRDDGIDGSVQDSPQLRLAFAQRLLGVLALGQVAHDPEEPPALRAANLAERKLQREDRAVAAPSLDLAADADYPRLARAKVAREVFVVSLAIGRRHQHGDVLADELGWRVAEQMLDRRVGGLHDAALVYDRDAVDRSLEKRLELAITRQAYLRPDTYHMPERRARSPP